MNPYDQMKALREEISGLNDTIAVLRRSEQHAREKMNKIEKDHGAIAKALNILQIDVQRKKETLSELLKQENT